jgi:hypothetical protein
MSDHSISQLFLIFLFAGTIFYNIIHKIFKRLFGIWFRLRTNKIFFEKTLVYAFISYCWELIFSKRLFRTNIDYIKKIGSFIFGSVVTNGGLPQSIKSPSVYTQFQRYLIYLSQILMVFVAGIAFILVLKRFSKSRKLSEYFNDYSFSMYFIVIGLVGYVLTLFFGQTKWNTFTNVFIWFPLISVVMIISLFFDSFESYILGINIKYLIVLLFVILVYSGNLLLNYHPNVIYPSTKTTMVIEYKEYKNPSIYYSAKWLSENSGTNPIVIGDRSIFDIYSGLFRFDQVMDFMTRDLYLSNLTYYETRFLKWPVWVGNYDLTLRQRKLDFVVINKDLLSFPSYLLGNPMDTEYFEKFDSSNKTSKIYDNQKILIYHNLRGG